MKIALKDRYKKGLNPFPLIRRKIHERCEKVTQSLEVSKPKNQILVLDGLRAIACLAVISYHLNSLSAKYAIWTPHHSIYNLLAPIIYFGESGVILFFLLSGFLLFLPYAKSLVFNTIWPSSRRFYLRRFFRIIPAYYSTLFFMILFFHPTFLHRNLWHVVWTFLTFRMGFELSQSIDGPFWTLAIEFQFYLLLPLIAWVLSLIVPRGVVYWRVAKLVFCLFLLMLWGELTRYWGLHIASTSKLDFLIPHRIAQLLEPYIYGDNGKYFEVFAVGMLLSVLYTYAQCAITADYWQRILRRFSSLLLIGGLLVLYFLSIIHFYLANVDVSRHVNFTHTYTFLDPYMGRIVHYWQLYQALAYAISYGLCMCAILYGPPKLKRPFEWSVFRWIGLISFSLYMWHVPFMILFMNAIGINILKQGFIPAVDYFAFCGWILVVIVPLALTWYRWIEMPGMRLGEYMLQKLGKKREPRSEDETRKIAELNVAPIRKIARP
jgi:peptidoglycan/LPS O-acetylase OafA/YrhL